MDSVSSYRWQSDRHLSARERRVYWENEVVRLTQDLGEAIKRNDAVAMSRYDQLLQGALASVRRYDGVERDELQRRLT